MAGMTAQAALAGRGYLVTYTETVVMSHVFTVEELVEHGLALSDVLAAGAAGQEVADLVEDDWQARDAVIETMAPGGDITRSELTVEVLSPAALAMGVGR